MSIWSKEELEQLDYVEIRTTKGGVLITVRSPGVCTITDGDGIPIEWDIRNGFGLAGATQVFMRLGLAEFSLKIRIWTPAHRAELKAFDAAIEPSPPGRPQRVYQISNPRLAFRGITQCTFLNAPLPVGEGDMSDTITYKCRQWRKPLPTLTAPTAAGGASAQGNATDAFVSRIAERGAVLEGLAGQLFGGP